jgi:hypothetical protein
VSGQKSQWKFTKNDFEKVSTIVLGFLSKKFLGILNSWLLHSKLEIIILISHVFNPHTLKYCKIKQKMLVVGYLRMSIR